MIINVNAKKKCNTTKWDIKINEYNNNKKKQGKEKLD